MTKSLYERDLILLGAAAKLSGLLYDWNVIDLRELAVEDSRKGTPYYHVTTALEKVLIELGLTADEKMPFCDLVTTGMSADEARQRILDHRPQDDGNED